MTDKPKVPPSQNVTTVRDKLTLDAILAEANRNPAPTARPVPVRTAPEPPKGE